MYFEDIEKVQRRTPIAMKQQDASGSTSGPLPLPGFVASSVGSYVRMASFRIGIAVLI
jgi:hypothetical protein